MDLYSIVFLLYLPFQWYVALPPSLPSFCGQLVSLIHCKLIQLTCVGVSFHWLWEIILACVLHQSGQSPPTAGCCVVQLSHYTNQFS